LFELLFLGTGYDLMDATHPVTTEHPDLDSAGGDNCRVTERVQAAAVQLLNGLDAQPAEVAGISGPASPNKYNLIQLLVL